MQGSKVKKPVNRPRLATARSVRRAAGRALACTARPAPHRSWGRQGQL